MIFISYRHGDRLFVRSLQTTLESRLGPSVLVRDISAFPPGADLRRVILDHLGRADQVLAVIGPQWLATDPATGRTSRFAAGDWVRFELSTALAWHKEVIPVLIEQTPMPDRAALPSDLAGLADRVALRVRDSDWEADVSRLLMRIPHSLAELPGPRIEHSGPVAGGDVTIQGHLAAGRDLTIGREDPPGS